MSMGSDNDLCTLNSSWLILCCVNVTPTNKMLKQRGPLQHHKTGGRAVEWGHRSCERQGEGTAWHRVRPYRVMLPRANLRHAESWPKGPPQVITTLPHSFIHSPGSYRPRAHSEPNTVLDTEDTTENAADKTFLSSEAYFLVRKQLRYSRHDAKPSLHKNHFNFADK